MSPYHILSLDGGGIRGILTASILERLEASQPGLLGMVDLFAGTSTGGILALAMASGMSPSEACELYERCGNKVFHDTLFDNVMDLGQLTGAQYSNGPLKQELEKQFGSMTLDELPKKVIISSFDLDNEDTSPGGTRFWKPKFFHNYPSADSDGHELVVDVALRTAAAPTFFPIYQGFIDGGVISNNPTMCAVAQAVEPNTGKQKLRDLRVLSVGTGYNPRYLEEMDGDWGLLKWAPHLVSLMLEGSVNLANYQCKQILGERYHRINPMLPVAISLDGLDQIPLMKGLASQYDLENSRAWLKKNFRPAKKAQPAAVSN